MIFISKLVSCDDLGACLDEITVAGEANLWSLSASGGVLLGTPIHAVNPVVVDS